MLVLAALAAVASTIPQPSQASAQVAVRIVAAARASAAEWRQAPRELRRETMITIETGERVPARLIEHQ